MWQKILEYIARFLLVPLLKKGVSSLFDWWHRRAEQKKRHKENQANVEAYDTAKPGEARDEFENLP